MASEDEAQTENLKFVQFLGEGSQGTVELATDSSGNQFAVKLEGTRGSSLQHEHRVYNVLALHGVTVGIPRIYRFTKGRGEKPNMLSMQLLGPSLKERVEHVRFFEGSETLRLSRAALRILQRVHAAGVVHIDVRPRNLLLARSIEADGNTESDSGNASGDSSPSSESSEVEQINENESDDDVNESHGGNSSGGGSTRRKSSVSGEDNSESERVTNIESNDGEDTLFLVDFGVAEIFVTDLNKFGKPRVERGGQSFQSRAKIDIRMLLNCALEMVGPYSDGRQAVRNAVERAKFYLQSLRRDQDVDYDLMKEYLA